MSLKREHTLIPRSPEALHILCAKDTGIQVGFSLSGSLYVSKIKIELTMIIKYKSKVFIIAELSANHNGDLQVALETVRAAKRAGADAIKLQTYTAKTMTIDCKNDFFMIKQDTAWDGQYLYDLYKRAYTPWEWHQEFTKLAKEEGLFVFLLLLIIVLLIS